MSDLKRTLVDLERARAELALSGKIEEAEQIAQVVDRLRPRVVEPSGGVMTTGEAAKALGVRSVNTIKRWVREGQLRGFRRGGRVLVSIESVRRLATTEEAAAQRAYEEERDAAFAPFDVPDDVPDEELPSSDWIGAKPWESAAAARS